MKRPSKPEGVESKPRYKDKSKSLKQAIEDAHLITELEVRPGDIDVALFKRLDDRSLAILLAANVENALELAILKRITVHKGERRTLFRSDGPLGSFANKIAIGYALDIFGPVTKSNLDITRHIRNVFAHAKKDIDFSTEQIVELITFFKFPPKIESTPGLEDADEEIDDLDKIKPARRAYFIISIITELSLLRYTIRAQGRIIRLLGGDPGPDQTPRIRFDDSLP